MGYRLTAASLTRKKAGLYADTVNGLYLRISPSGAKTWVVKFRRKHLGGNAREMGLGSCLTLKLADAREKARLIQKDIGEGIDPILKRRGERAVKKTIPTFEIVAKQFVKERSAGWSRQYEHDFGSGIARYVLPEIGTLKINEIDRATILRVLSPIWKAIPKTANDIRGRIEMILDFAEAQGQRSGENPARWSVLKHVFQPPRALKPIAHLAALPHEQIGSFMAAMRANDHRVARALEFLILTASRPAPIRLARWREIDLTKKLWIVPALHMKSGRGFTVPLSPAALVTLGERQDDDDFVFGKFHDHRLIEIARTIVPAITAHGFRSTFRDWCGSVGIARELAELCLDHRLGNAAEQAYARDSQIAARRKIMDRWADRLGRSDDEAIR